MKVDSFGAVPAARVCTLPSKAERAQMNDNVVIVYNGEQVSVPKEVADFLEQDRKREQAQERQDARHLSNASYNIVTVEGAAASRVFFHLKAEAVRMGE